VDDYVSDDYGVGGDDHGDCGDFLNRLTKLFQLHEYHLN
jgi:hypothetical protein